MKTYTKRILTWLMVIAMLTGIILTDYRAPVFSRAEEATATQANTDGTSASSSTEAGEQTGPQTEGAQEQTSPDATTQGAETQSGEQGAEAANAPANQTDQGPQDITKHVTYTLEKFYVKEYNTETKKWERKYIINNGEKVNNPPAIYQNSGVGLEWSWEISEEGIESITKGSYFKIPVPTDNIISSNHEFSFYDPNGTEAGVFQVKDGFLTATFGDYKAAAGNDKLKDGIFKIEASMNKIIEKLTIPITNKEVSEKTVDISVVPRPKPDYDGPKPDQFTEQTWFPSFSKDGGQGAWQRNNDKIQYTFYINYQAIKDKFEEKNTKIKKKVIVEDKIPDKLSLELQDIEIYTPLFYPTYNTDGTLNKKPSNAKRINALLYKSTISPVNRNFEAIVGPTESYKTEESFENAVKNATKPTVGVWNKQYLLINFGNIPETLKYSSASTLINNKWGNTIEQRIEDDLRKNLITNEQANKAKELYAESLPVPAYNVTFTVGIKDLKQTTFTNKAVLTSEGEKALESTKEVQTVIGEGKFNFDKALVNIEVNKKWFGKKQDKIEVELIKEGESTGKKIELSSSNNWTGYFNGLKKYHKKKEIKYTVKEKSIPSYKVEVGEPIESDDSNKSIQITNIELTDIPVEKIWSVPGGEQLPDSVQVNLLKKGSNDIIKTLTLKKGNDGKWIGVFKDVPKCDESNNEIEYIVEEVAVPGYESKVTGDMEEGFTITNTKAKINIPVTKKWTGFDVGKGPDDVSKVEVVLWADGKPTTQELTLSKDNQWQGRFENLDIRNSEGNSISYTVKEVEIPWYETKVEQKNATDITQGFTITNTKVPPITITVDKKWVRQEKDSSYTDLPKKHKSIPKSIEVQLIRKGVSDVEVETKELTKEGGWETTFAPVPSKDSNGNPIQYAVKEKEVVTGFALAEQVNVQNGKATLTNILTDRIVNIKIDKKWMKGNNELPNVSETEVPVEILYRKKGSKDKFESYRSNLKIEKGKDWKLEVEGLPEIDPNGEELEYAIREVKIPSGYFASSEPVTGKDLKFTLTNTVIPKREIKVVKKWIDETGKDLGSGYLRIPNEVKVKLWKKAGENGTWEDTGKVIILTKSSWTASFTGLDTVDPYGRKITYRIQEIQGTTEFDKEFTKEGIQVEIEDNQPQVVITNKKTPDQVEIKVHKKWLDLNNSPITDRNRLPDGVKFLLFADGQFKDAIMVSKSNGWQYRERLPKFDTNGKEIVYTIKEDALYGYTATIQKESGGLSFTATNKENPTPPGNPFIPPFIPDEPVPTPPNIPTPPAPNVPIDELVIEDDEVVLAGNDEEDLDDPEITDEPEDEEITDDLPRSNKDVPKTADFFMSGFANPLAVSTVIMMGYGLKKLVAKKKKD